MNEPQSEKQIFHLQLNKTHSTTNTHIYTQSSIYILILSPRTTAYSPVNNYTQSDSETSYALSDKVIYIYTYYSSNLGSGKLRTSADTRALTR